MAITSILSSLFSTSTLAKAAFETLSTPAQVGLGALGIVVAGDAAHSAYTGGLPALRTIRHAGGTVSLPCGGQGTVTRMGLDHIEVLRGDGTVVTLRGEDRKAVLAGKIARDPEAAKAAQGVVSEINSGSTGGRVFTRVIAEDRALSSLERAAESQKKLEASLAMQAEATALLQEQVTELLAKAAGADAKEKALAQAKRAKSAVVEAAAKAKLVLMAKAMDAAKARVAADPIAAAIDAAAEVAAAAAEAPASEAEVGEVIADLEAAAEAPAEEVASEEAPSEEAPAEEVASEEVAAGKPSAAAAA